MGSKRRIAKYILPKILKERSSDQIYCEPFVGGCNKMDKVTGPRIGCDINEYLIEMWRAVSDGWMPRSGYTEEEYNYIRRNKDECKYLTGYIGFALTYGGKFFGGWSRGKLRDYTNEAYLNACRQFPKLRSVHFIHCSYDELEVSDAIIYCDPPYAGVTTYKNDIDHEHFWEWCRVQHYLGNKVFISEYNAPDDFKCIFKINISSFVRGKKSDIREEKLFRYKEKVLILFNKKII